MLHRRVGRNFHDRTYEKAIESVDGAVAAPFSTIFGYDARDRTDQ